MSSLLSWSCRELFVLLSSGRLGVEGTERGLAATMSRLIRRREIPYEELGGAATLAGGRSASGRRNEFDVVLGRTPEVVVIELKNWKQEVPAAHAMLLLQKVLDHWALRTRVTATVHPVIACSSGLSDDARRFCFIWGVLPIEPDLIPPVLLLDLLDGYEEARRIVSHGDRVHAKELFSPFVSGVTEQLSFVTSNRGPGLRARLQERMDFQRSLTADLLPWLESESGPLREWTKNQERLLR